MRLLDSAKSFTAAMRASAIAARGFRLRDCGDTLGALKQARSGLVVLSKPYVRRTSPPEAAALISLTVLAEEAAMPLFERGASVTDLRDAIAMLKRAGEHNQSNGQSALAFLEARLAATSLTSSA